MQNTNKNVVLVEGQHDLIIIKIVVMSTSTTISSTRR
jgi:5S rRNA maturation endonuclease (ribonuclease M5)